jgi:hypothetical protein
MKSQPIEAPVRVFGTWDAPVTDDAKRIDVPVARLCMHCRETFRDGDNGAIMPNGFAQHRECALRVALGGIGHHVDHVRTGRWIDIPTVSPSGLAGFC